MQQDDLKEFIVLKLGIVMARLFFSYGMTKQAFWQILWQVVMSNYVIAKLQELMK